MRYHVLPQKINHILDKALPQSSCSPPKMEKTCCSVTERHEPTGWHYYSPPQEPHKSLKPHEHNSNSMFIQLHNFISYQDLNCKLMWTVQMKSTSLQLKVCAAYNVCCVQQIFDTVYFKVDCYTSFQFRIIFYFAVKI
jgi:hypothetical protein